MQLNAFSDEHIHVLTTRSRKRYYFHPEVSTLTLTAVTTPLRVTSFFPLIGCCFPIKGKLMTLVGFQMLNVSIGFKCFNWFQMLNQYYIPEVNPN